MEPPNRYAPPASTVADAASGRGPLPAQVRLAVWLLWASLAVSAGVALVASFREVQTGAEPVWLLGFVVLMFAVFAWIVSRVRAGRWWARAVCFALFLIGLLAMLIDASTAGETALEIAATVVSTLLDAVAFVLLFTRPGNAWFRS